jgi:putative acetyltransferase
MSNLKIKEVKYDNEDLTLLINKLDKFLLDQYPDRPIFGVDANNENMNDLIFLVGYFEDKAIACGALRFYSDKCELKRMFVDDEYRGKGFSKSLYYELENIAINNKKKKIILETGNKQETAIEMYKKLGFTRIENYGEFLNDKISVCFEKTL